MDLNRHIVPTMPEKLEKHNLVPVTKTKENTVRTNQTRSLLGGSRKETDVFYTPYVKRKAHQSKSTDKIIYAISYYYDHPINHQCSKSYNQLQSFL